MWLLLFLFSTPFSSYALSNNDKTEPQNQQITNVINAINSKLELADKNRRADPLKFRQLLKELDVEQASFTKEQLNYYKFLTAYNSAYTGQYEESEKKLKALLNSDASYLIRYRANFTLINISAVKEEWADGLSYIANNAEFLPHITNKVFYQEGFLNTITFYNQLKQYELALKNIEALEKQFLIPNNNCYLKQFALEARLNLHQLSLSDGTIKEAIEICLQADNNIGLNLIRSYQAELLIIEGTPEKALELLLPLLKEIENTHFPMLVAVIDNIISEAYFQLNDKTNSKYYALKSLSANNGTNNIKRAVHSYKLLYQIAKLDKDFQLSLEYHEKYSELDKAHLEGDKAKYLAFQLTQHQASEQETQIQLLHDKNALLEAEQALSDAESANTQLIIMVLTASIVLLILWAARLFKTHKRIKELAEYDALTGIFNRGHFTHIANSALKYCQNAEQDLSMIIFDLDHFKSINDNYGHATGDWALKETIRVCQGLGRKNDVFARLGGEEFCILLPSCNLRSAALRAEQCREAIASIITQASGHDFLITASFGVTDANTSGFELEKLLADADSAAYDSKHAGRNCVTVFTLEEMSQQEQLDAEWSIA